jgi:hypothetical protein
LLPAVPAIKAVRAELFTTLTLGSGFVGSARADLLGSDLWPESEFAAVTYQFLFRGVGHEVRILDVRHQH